MQQHLQTDIVQSFWLRFWREPHRGPHREWRGSIWHEQQAAHDKPTIVANPEEAFEFVRHVLRGDAGDSIADDTDVPGRPTGGGRAGLRHRLQRLAGWWRGSKGAKP
ncbi:MAG: hypothetical protein JSR72_22400 [Proteobacteria bacterium]|nr:hypothetical protein [Pseudomonadota bacterium]